MMNDLFGEIEIVERNDKNIRKCRTCIHRKRYALNEYSPKVVQCCELQKSRRSNSGYKTIKVTDIACMAYKEKE